MDQDIVPFGIVDNGVDDPFDKEEELRDIKEKWVNSRQGRYVFDNLEWDTLSNKHKL